jgi:MoaA/NifB/PqqE/SkfB family radical SAM enzyme
MFKVTSKWPHQKSVHVEWNLGKRCNLDCAYCPAEIHDNFSPHTDINLLKATVDKLVTLQKPVRISLTGGEPCVHPRIDELLDYMSKKISWINVTSNGTRKPEWYVEQPVSHYVFSLHFEDNDWDRFLNNILLFGQLNEDKDRIPFQVNVMAHHLHMDRVKQACNVFDGHNIKYAVRRIRWTEKHDWFDDMRYKHQDLDWILKHDATVLPNCVIDDTKYMHANDIIKENLNQFEGWSCSAGIESLMINWDGEVHRATCRVGGSLGNIYKDTFEAPKEWVTCTRRWCTCAADIPLTKVST